MPADKAHLESNLPESVQKAIDEYLYKTTFQNSFGTLKQERQFYFIQSSIVKCT
jgi:hypothetical protein